MLIVDTFYIGAYIIRLNTGFFLFILTLCSLSVLSYCFFDFLWFFTSFLGFLFFPIFFAYSEISRNIVFRYLDGLSHRVVLFIHSFNIAASSLLLLLFAVHKKHICVCLIFYIIFDFSLDLSRVSFVQWMKRLFHLPFQLSTSASLSLSFLNMNFWFPSTVCQFGSP